MKNESISSLSNEDKIKVLEQIVKKLKTALRCTKEADNLLNNELSGHYSDAFAAKREIEDLVDTYSREVHLMKRGII